jgi:DNA-directed RNA polymerase specialized sigma subunit
MNFKKMNGKLIVEIITHRINEISNLSEICHEYVETKFPTKEEFFSLYENREFSFVDRDWEITNSRFYGKTISECAKKFGLSGERIRQIENKFMRLMGRKLDRERKPK